MQTEALENNLEEEKKMFPLLIWNVQLFNVEKERMPPMCEAMVFSGQEGYRTPWGAFGNVYRYF